MIIQVQFFYMNYRESVDREKLSAQENKKTNGENLKFQIIKNRSHIFPQERCVIKNWKFETLWRPLDGANRNTNWTLNLDYDHSCESFILSLGSTLLKNLAKVWKYCKNFMFLYKN